MECQGASTYTYWISGATRTRSMEDCCTYVCHELNALLWKFFYFKTLKGRLPLMLRCA